MIGLIRWLFAPRPEGTIRDWTPPAEPWFEERGWAGNVRERPYRDGIDRYFSEEDKPATKRVL